MDVVLVVSQIIARSSVILIPLPWYPGFTSPQLCPVSSAVRAILQFSLLFLTTHLMFPRSGNWTLSSSQQTCPKAARAVLRVPVRATASWVFFAIHGTPGQRIPGFHQSHSSGEQSPIVASSETLGGWTLISRCIGYFSLWFPFIILSFTGSGLSFPTSSHHRTTCII